jgi:hypothetical protein
MRILLAIAALLAAGTALLYVLGGSGGGRASAASAGSFESAPASSASRERSAGTSELEARLAALEEAFQRLELELGLLASERRDAASPEAPAPVFVPESEHTPEWYLEQYVLSFRDGGQGSEYFRLAVEAYAPSLSGSIRRHVASPAANELLRLKLIEVLGDARFARDGRAIDVLLAIVRGAPSALLVQAALAALAEIGDEGVARALESVVWGLGSRELELAASRVALALSGEGADACVARLLLRAPDDAATTMLLSLLTGADLAAVLDAHRTVSRATQPVRLAGAESIARFHGEAVAAFVDEWLGYETDPEVRARLEAARGEVLSKPAWSAAQAEGPPDVPDPANDDQRAWAARLAEMGEQWLEVAFDPPERASAIVVHETSVAGGVVQVIGIEAGGRRSVLWSGVDPTTSGGRFEVRFATTERPLAGVRIVLDTNRRQGWEEIDAVELVGPAGSSFAVRALASSSYASR